MKYLLSLLLLVISFEMTGQPLRDINYNYLYNPGESLTLDLKAVRKTDHWIVFYKLQLRDTTLNIEEFSINWENRESISDKEGSALPSDLERSVTKREKLILMGKLTIPNEVAPKILAARVINSTTKKAWMFYQLLEPNYPVINYATTQGEVALKPYVNISDKFLVDGSAQWTVSYYDDNFPTASPPFAEAQARVNRGMITDSTFYVTGGQQIDFTATGLYLIQKDTNTAEGIAFRAADDYPRLGKIQSLVGPLVYICTKQEHDRLVLAKGEKKNFDRVIISITSDTDRARKFMRGYFRRVELANQYFTSYKEGWKTDRGMIYIIFGLPDEVYKFNDREVWDYKNDLYKVSFSFLKASSIFDPDNYVLIREKKYQQTWYEVIDLWRNARF